MSHQKKESNLACIILNLWSIPLPLLKSNVYKKLGRNFDVIIKTRITAIPIIYEHKIHIRKKETFILKSNSDLEI